MRKIRPLSKAKVLAALDEVVTLHPWEVKALAGVDMHVIEEMYKKQTKLVKVIRTELINRNGIYQRDAIKLVRTKHGTEWLNQFKNEIGYK